MHEHDPDLIAALADGSLDDRSGAQALVETCESCRAEYEAQVRVLGMLAAAPVATMSDLEKAALHRDLWTELRRASSGAPSTPWWLRWSYAAAGLLVLVGVGSVLGGQIMGGDEATGSFSEIGSGLDSATDQPAPFVAGDRAGEAEAESEASTTAAASEGTLPPSLPELAEQARAEDRDHSLGTTSADDEAAECVARAGLIDQRVVDKVELDQIYLLVMPENPEAEPIVTFVTLADCEVVFVDR